MTTLIFLIVGAIIVLTGCARYLTAVSIGQGISGVFLIIFGLSTSLFGLLLPLT